MAARVQIVEAHDQYIRGHWRPSNALAPSNFLVLMFDGQRSQSLAQSPRAPLPRSVGAVPRFRYLPMPKVGMMFGSET